jgi:arginine deiminase
MAQPEGKTLNINSEIGILKSVMLHRPGTELERITPEHLSEVLFEDIPWLSRMRQEHDSFASELKSRGVEVLYVEELLKDVFRIDAVRDKILADVLEESETCDKPVKDFLYDFLKEKSVDEFAEFLIGGISKEDIRAFKKEKSLSDFIKEDHYFYINPLPNLYFMRDPAVVIGEGIAIGSMRTPIRKRESLFLRLIYDNHQIFDDIRKEPYYSQDYHYSVEGGDVLVLSEDTLAVGCSQRTGVAGIEMLADRLLKKDTHIKKLLVIQIPKVRAYMHLDTVFTMVDYDKFTIYPGILDRINVITVEKNQTGRLCYKQEENLEMGLKKHLKLDRISLIPSGGIDPIIAAREQWNDSTNTFAIAPARVMAYGRNEVSNKVLRKNGIDVIELEASELVRGRGGPRCMSMPLYRESI